MQSTLTRKIAAGLMGLAIAAGALGSAPRASAAGLTPTEAAVIAGFGGFVVGSMIAERHHRHHRHVAVDRWELHVMRCEARYSTYDPVSDTFVGFDGDLHRCRL